MNIVFFQVFYVSIELILWFFFFSLLIEEIKITPL